MSTIIAAGLHIGKSRKCEKMLPWISCYVCRWSYNCPLCCFKEIPLFVLEDWKFSEIVL